MEPAGGRALQRGRPRSPGRSRWRGAGSPARARGSAPAMVGQRSAEPLLEHRVDLGHRERPHQAPSKPGLRRARETPSQSWRRPGTGSSTARRHHSHPVTLEPAQRELQHPGRGHVEPLSVIDGNEHRPIHRQGGHQRRERRGDDPPFGRRAIAVGPQERHVDRLALRHRQPVESTLGHRTEQVSQCRVRQRDLDGAGPTLQDPKPETVRPTDRFPPQRGLADTGFTIDHELDWTAQRITRLRQRGVDHTDLGLAPYEPAVHSTRVPTLRRARCPPPRPTWRISPTSARGLSGADLDPRTPPADEPVGRRLRRQVRPRRST